MREEIQVTGIILYATLVKEYDKRLVILTKEREKITVFANGARKAVSQLRAASQSFVMGTFTVYVSQSVGPGIFFRTSFGYGEVVLCIVCV